MRKYRIAKHRYHGCNSKRASTRNCLCRRGRNSDVRPARATPQADHRLLLEFANGEIRLFDLTPYLDKGVFRALRDSAQFAQAQIGDGSVEWPGEVDLSYDTLYLRSAVVQSVSA